MKVAILLSSYNGDKFIEQQISSILNQTINGMIHLFVRDDGSSDNTVKILRRFKAERKLTLIEGENLGYVNSFFELIKCVYDYGTEYNFYSFADQDDVWDSDKIEIAVEALGRNNNSIPLLYASSSRLVDENLDIIGITQGRIKEISFFNSIIQNFCPGHTQVMNYSMLEIVMKYYQPQFIYVHDSFILNAAILTGKLIFDDSPHTSYRQHSSNQLGMNKDFISWLNERCRRIVRGDGKKYAEQINFILDSFKDYMLPEQKDEMDKFRKMQRNIFTRIKYSINTKLYRQKKLENLLFRLYYVMGGYKIP